MGKKNSKVATANIISADERRWRAESDARTLMEAKTIQGDGKRMKAAAKAAVSMAKEKEKEANAMKAVAKCKKG